MSIHHNNKISIEDKFDNNITYISNYFKTYNLISWNINKLYSTPENNKHIKDYCESLENLTKCKPPYDSLTLTNTFDDLCKFKEIGISKKSIHLSNINSLIIKDNINFKFIKDYPQFTTSNSKTSLYTYLKQLIIQNLDNITQNQSDNIIHILQDNDYDMTNNITNIIMSDDFYHIDDILDIIFPNKDYINNLEYINLKKISNAKLPPHSIQHHTNKLFQQTINNKYDYYFYFSFG